MTTAYFGLFFAAAAQHGHLDPARTGRAIAALKARIVAALTDPLALLDRRSPGSRRAGILHNTKMAAVPHERVLAGVRQREIPPGFLAPPQAGPALAENGPVILAPAPSVIPGAPPASPAGGPVGGPVGGTLMPAFIGSPSGSPGFFGNPLIGPFVSNTPSGRTGTSNPPGGPEITENPPPGPPTPPPGPPTPPPGTPTPPPDTPTPPPSTPTPPPGTPVTPPDTCCGPDTPPPDIPPGTPPTTPLPEPASWTLMLLGVIVVVAMRQKRRAA